MWSPALPCGMAHLPAYLFRNPPVVVFMKCRGAGRPTREYVGEWPRRGRIYPCQVRRDPDGYERVFVEGVGLPLPYYGFQRRRFKLLAEVWLN